MTTKSYDPSNVFAKILRGEIPSVPIFETDEVRAIMDVMPQSRGHCLVLPKAPSRNLLDADDETIAVAFSAARRLARAVKAAFGADGVVVSQFNEEAAGQTVFHLHIHVIPRFDGVPLAKHSGSMADRSELERHAEQIRAALD